MERIEMDVTEIFERLIKDGKELLVELSLNGKTKNGMSSMGIKVSEGKEWKVK